VRGAPARLVPVLAAAILSLVLVALPLGAPRAEGAAGPPSAAALTAELASSTPNLRMQAAEAQKLAAPVPPGAFAAARQAMQAGAAGERFRDSVRTEQEAIYVLAGNPSLAAQVQARLGSQAPPGLPSVLGALQAVFTLGDVTAPPPHFIFPYNSALPVATLESYYQRAAAEYGLDWRYLAAINFLESHFDRDTRVSPAGAQGPMQFEPSTWAEYGDGGNIHDPHDAIYAAARYLSAMGAPGDYTQAILRYNDDDNYLAAVRDLAAAIGVDGLWLERLYYWSTYG